MSEFEGWLIFLAVGAVVWIGITVLDHHLRKLRERYARELEDRNDRRCHERKKAYQEVVKRAQETALEIQHKNQMAYLDRIQEINEGTIPGDEWKH